MRDHLFVHGRGPAAALVLASVALAIPSTAVAQWSTVYDQVYLPGKFNWQFRHNYPAADRLFNAFDYGHAILYERLWTRPDAPASDLEEKEYDFLTRDVLVRPPKLPLEEAAIEVAYAKLVPEAKMMFDWAHLFHRQVYDVWADERIPVADKDAKVAELIRYYRSRRDLAFSTRPKTMELMEAQPYSLAFRKGYPKFNGLIWAYHWLQVGLYEPLVTGRNLDERQTGVLAAVARFRQMLEDPPTNMPRVMPMTAAIAPTFAERYAEAAIIFDNLHSMHDVVSDILANDSVPRSRKRALILEAARRYRDDTSSVTTVAEWRDMARMMGVENMGGPVVGFVAGFPTPTVARGAVMAGMDHSKMPGMQKDTAAAMDHARMGPDRVAARDTSRAVVMMELHLRMMADSVIRQRVLADTVMRRLMTETLKDMPAEHREHLESMLREVPRPPTPAKPVDPHAGHPKPPPTKPPATLPPGSRR